MWINKGQKTPIWNIIFQGIIAIQRAFVLLVVHYLFPMWSLDISFDNNSLKEWSTYLHFGGISLDLSEILNCTTILLNIWPKNW
jgi:hypothetical protein